MYHVSVYRSILNSADSLLATGLDSLVAWGLALERGASSGIVLEGVVGVLAIFLRRERVRFFLGLSSAGVLVGADWVAAGRVGAVVAGVLPCSAGLWLAGF